MLFLAPLFTLGQDGDTLSRTILKLSPQHFIDNSLKAGIERFNAKHTGSASLFITAMIDNTQYTGFYYGSESGYDGLAGELQFRKYFSPMQALTSINGKVYHQGIYGGAYLQGGSYSADLMYSTTIYDPVTGSQHVQEFVYSDHIGNWGVGFTIGYQRTLWQVVFFEAFVGGGVQFADRLPDGSQPRPSYYYRTGITNPSYQGIIPKFGLNIGLGL